jgi:hypothetical protein
MRMTANFSKTLRYLALLAAIATACDDDTNEPTIPRSGLWVGANVSLFVAPGSAKLSTAGSTLLDNQGGPLAIQLTVICNPSLTRTFYGRGEVTIANNTFSTGNNPDWSVTGTFTSATTVSGTFTVANGSECNLSGSWSAEPVSAP